MMPMYMNSSQQGQTRPQGHYHHQGFETNNPHHHMTMDAPCGYWPTPSPSPCYGSCIHGNNFPAYQGYWPPCYHSQVPYHHPCCMNHSGFHPHAPPCYSHQPFPVSYQPMYESEKDLTGKHHCAKCSPHPKSNRGVVIEEHEPEIDEGDHGEAVQSARSSTFPYPVIWIPHENARIQESHDQPPEVQRSDPKSWNGCFPLDERALKSLVQNHQDRNKMQNGRTVEFPFDINKLKSLLQAQGPKVQENGSGSHDQLPAVVKAPEKMELQKSDPRYLNGYFPFDESTLKSLLQNQEKKKSENGKSVELPFDISKLKSLLQGQDGKEVQSQKNKEEQEQILHSDAEEQSLARTIPVENHLQEPRNIPVKLSSENHLQTPTEQTKRVTKEEPVEKTKKVQYSSSSSPKASRLPPVCLRVDPLPKRKNGGSKSLSPPRRKEQEETKVASPLSSKKAESKTVPEACNIISKEMKESVESNSNLREEANSTKESTEKSVTKTFTDEEAARIIQSMYRGYDVRRWEPLKKLKEIATVREQMHDVEKRVQALEGSSNDKHIEEKEIIVLEETVMNLLIKLDSVQGLHHSIREYRKSLARELSNIEEKLDSIKKCNAMMEEEAVKEAVEITYQTSDCAVKGVEQSQIEEENKDSKDTEKVLLPQNPSPEAQEGEGPESTEAATENGEVETALPINLLTTTKSEDDKVIVETLEEKSQLAEEKQTVSESKDTEKVLMPSPEEHEPMSVMNRPVEQLTAEAGESEKVEVVLPIDPVTKSEEDKVMVEDPASELPQVVEIGTETESYEERKEEDETMSSSEKLVELSELPDDDVASLVSQDSSSITGQEGTTNNETCESRNPHETVTMKSEEMNNKTYEPQEETEVVEDEVSEETKRLKEENERFKETVETLVKAGREQIEVISKLTGRVKSLEKKLSMKKKKKSRHIIGRRGPNRGKQGTKPMSVNLIL